MSAPDRRPVDEPSTWLTAALVTVVFTGVLWGSEVVDTWSGGRLDAYGIRPRSDEGLLGILWSPLLHGGFGHLIGNTVPVVVLMFLVLASGVGRGLAVTAAVWLVGGLGVWLTAPSGSVTIGASGLVFGWLVYLIVRGAFTRRVGEILLGMVLFLLWGGILLGVLPGQPGVSWQGHLFGAIGGGLAAYWFNGRVDERSRSYV